MALLTLTVALFGLTGTAFAGTAPTVQTGMPAAQSGTSVSLSGVLNPNGLSTTYQFEYGTTTAYGSTAPAKPGSAGAGSADLPIGEGVSGLSSGTLYHYRLAATNSEGTRYGSDRTFETVASGATSSNVSWPFGTAELTASESGAEQVLYSATAAESPYTSNGVLLKCNEAMGGLGASWVSAASTIPVENLSYSHSTKEANHCIGPLGTSPLVSTNSCPFEFHVGKSIGSHEAEGSLSANCPGVAAVSSNASICKVYVGSGQNLGPVTYKTVGEDVQVKLALKNLTVIYMGLCAYPASSKMVTDGEFTGTMVLKGNLGKVTVN